MADHRCDVCECYINAKNVESHEAGKQHKRQLAQKEIQAQQKARLAGIKRPLHGISSPATMPQTALEWLNLMHSWSKSHSEFAKRYKPLFEKLASSGNQLAGHSSDVSQVTNSDVVDKTATEPKVFAIDCEMVLAKRASGDEEARVLARVSVIEWKWTKDAQLVNDLKAFSQGNCSLVMDHYVKLSEEWQLLDLLTHVSGIEQHHLDSATLESEDVRAKLVKLVGPQDILVGHSLWADFSALGWAHPKFLDTSLVFAIQDLANFTPSLKDVVVELFNNSSERKSDLSQDMATTSIGKASVASGAIKTAESNKAVATSQLDEPDTSTLVKTQKHHSFQVAGESHDSIEDAKWAMRTLAKFFEVKQEEFKVLSSEPNSDPTSVLPFRLPRVPERLQKRLTLQSLPNEATEELVMDILRTGGTIVNELLDHAVVNPIKWAPASNNGRYGTCAVVFRNSIEARQVFNALQCTKFERKFDRCPTGWPDTKLFLRKTIALPTPMDTKSCNLFSYFRLGAVSHSGEKLLGVPTPILVSTIPQKSVGRLMGPKGRRIAFIRETTGVMVKVTQNNRSGNHSKRPKHSNSNNVEAKIEYFADRREQVDEAAKLVRDAVFNCSSLGIE